MGAFWPPSPESLGGLLEMAPRQPLGALLEEQSPLSLRALLDRHMQDARTERESRKPRSVLSAFDMPLGSRRDYAQVSETGRPVYQDVAGNRFEIGPQPPSQGLVGLLKSIDWDKMAAKGRGGAGAIAEIAQFLLNFRQSPEESLEMLGSLLPQAAARATRGEPVTLGGVWETALEAAGASGFVRKPGTGIFGGRAAQTANQVMRQRAEEMAAKGLDRADIWEETGWFRGVDGKWRFEIDDSKAVFDAANLPKSGGVLHYGDGTLSEAFDHPTLYEAYPDLADMRRADYPWANSNLEGTYRKPDEVWPESIETWSGKSGEGAGAGANLHEVQHAVQRREGFAPGGSPGQFKRPVPTSDDVDWAVVGPILEKYGIEGASRQETGLGALHRIRDEALQKGVPFSEVAIIEAERKRLADLARSMPSQFRQYKVFAGEVEARNVEVRRTATAGQRREQAPWTTQDVPDWQQNVPGEKFLAGGGVSQSLTPPDPLAKYREAPGSRPEYVGQAPDRSDLTFLRYHPKTLPPRLERSLAAFRDPSNPVRQRLIADIKRGQTLGGDDWYNTEELRDWFIDELGAVRGDSEWREFMYLMGAASPGSKPLQNIATASLMRQGLSNPEYIESLLAIQTLKEGQALGKLRKKGYGHNYQGLQELVAARYLQGRWRGAPEPGVTGAKSSMVQNPKPKGFGNSFLGNRRNIAADLHFTRYMGMATGDPEWLETAAVVAQRFVDDLLAKYPKAKNHIKSSTVNGKPTPKFNAREAVVSGDVPMEAVQGNPKVWANRPNDTEYAAFEDLMAEIAAELDMTPSQAQANLWLGVADVTGVDPTSRGTFMELLRTRAATTATATGRTPEEVIRAFIRERGLLSLTGVATLGTALGMDNRTLSDLGI